MAGPAMRRGAGRGRQDGAVLMMVVFLLVIVGLTSVAVMRTAMSADLVAESARMRQVAWHAAHAALRYCEQELLRPEPAIDFLAAPAPGADPAWADWGRWATAARVPASHWSAGRGGTVPPQCLAELGRLPSGASVAVVTARGYSPDYDIDAQGGGGSVVWLQSLLTLVFDTADGQVEGGDCPSCPLRIVDRVWMPLAQPPVPESP